MTVSKAPGLRERKREETRQRLAQAALRLFTSNGYEATTLDAIAVEAGVSRRTFFHYFKSKDDILLSLQTGLGERLVAGLSRLSPEQGPLAAVRERVMQTAASYPLDELIVIDRLMRSSEAVQNRKQATYARDEAIVFAALAELWPDHSEASLRIVALLAIGIGRVAIDSWSRKGGKRSFTELLDEHFQALEEVCASPGVKRLLM